MGSGHRAGPQGTTTDPLAMRRLATICLAILVATQLLTACRSTSPATAFRETSASAASVNGLSLTLSVDSTSYHPGDKVAITIDEYNTLAAENRVDAADKWPVRWLTLGP